jgi:hypothetical protein
MTEKASVEVSIVKVQNAFEKKYETTLPPKMKAAMERAIKSSTNMQKPPNDKLKRFTLDATVTDLTKSGEDASTQVAAKLSMVLSDKDRAFGFLSGNGKVPKANPKKIDDDVEALVESLLEDLVKDKVSKAIKDRLAKAK